MTEKMVSEFPELTRIRGHYKNIFDNLQHWWCTDIEGNIVDPTVSQFGFKGEYVPYDESLGEPKGICSNCGGLVYDLSAYCGDDCRSEDDICGKYNRYGEKI